MSELRGYPGSATPRRPAAEDSLGGVAAPLRMESEAGLSSSISTTTVFGTPVDITLSELALESFFPADGATAEALRRLSG